VIQLYSLIIVPYLRLSEDRQKNVKPYMEHCEKQIKLRCEFIDA
jgi:hypothetical protein